MKYEIIKERVACLVFSAIERGGMYGVGGANKYEAAVAAMFNAIAERQSFDASLKELAGKAYDVIMAWDIRMVGRLRELFPEFFPKSLSKGKLVAEYDEQGDWVIFIDCGISADELEALTKELDTNKVY
jgi:hypothetical protein